MITITVYKAGAVQLLLKDTPMARCVHALHITHLLLYVFMLSIVAMLAAGDISCTCHLCNDLNSSNARWCVLRAAAYWGVVSQTYALLRRRIVTLVRT
jgi:hypothetical protein